jgi:hypothetical protein
MKVGDLVKVFRTHGREPITGLIIELKEDELNLIALVKPIASEHNRLMYANPLDVEVINASR